MSNKIKVVLALLLFGAIVFVWKSWVERNMPPGESFTIALNEGVLNVDATESTMPPDFIYTWDWGDGSPIDSGVRQSHTYHDIPPNGEYTITLEITDNDGNSYTYVRKATVTVTERTTP